MNLRNAAVVSALILSAGLARPAFACQCGEPLSVHEYLTNADTVFEGEVYGRWPQFRSQIDGYSIPVQTYYFHVLRSWKGDIVDKPTLSGFGGSCDFPFALGETYLVFAMRSSSSTHEYTTSQCSGNKLIGYAQRDLRDLGKEVMTFTRQSSSSSVLYGRIPSIMWASIATGYFYVAFLLSEPVRWVVASTVCALLVSIAVFPGVRFAKRRPVLTLILCVLCITGVGVMLFAIGYSVLTSRPMLSEYFL